MPHVSLNDRWEHALKTLMRIHQSPTTSEINKRTAIIGCDLLECVDPDEQLLQSVNDMIESMENNE